MWFPNRSDTNQAVQSQKTARNIKFCIYEEEGLYYPCSENKDTDQLRGYREADLCLCFRICTLLVFPWHEAAHIHVNKLRALPQRFEQLGPDIHLIFIGRSLARTVSKLEVTHLIFGFNYLQILF